MLKLLDRFHKFSGLKINAEKSSILRIRPWKHSEAKFYTLKRLFWSPSSIKILGFKIFPDLQEIFKENYDDVLVKVDEIIMAWKNRNLTIIGKVTVTNHLINTLFIHKLTVLPTPPDSFFWDHKNKITSFLWDNKIPKIRYDKITQSYEKNGIKLIDLKTKERALKIAWLINKLKREEDISWLWNNLKIRDKRIWECNLSPKDISALFGKQSLNIGKDFLYAWAMYNYEDYYDDPQQILNSIIWGNSKIRRANKPICQKRLVNSNIVRIIDIFNIQENRFYTYKELKDNCGQGIDELFYLGILAAIPQEWKNCIKQYDWRDPLDIDSRVKILSNYKQISQRYILGRNREKLSRK